MEARADLAGPARGRPAGCYATAVEALTFLYPTIYGVLAPTKPLNEDTVRRWYELVYLTGRGLIFKILRPTGA